MRWGGGCGRHCRPSTQGVAFGRASVVSQWGNVEPGAGPMQPNCSALSNSTRCDHTDGCGTDAATGKCGRVYSNRIALARMADMLRGVWFSSPKAGNCSRHAAREGGNGGRAGAIDSDGDGDGDGAVCTWSEVSRKISNATCTTMHVVDAIWAAATPPGVGKRCLELTCSGHGGDARPFQPCWTRCLVSAVLGDLPGQGDTAIPVSLMTQAFSDGLEKCATSLDPDA